MQHPFERYVNHSGGKSMPRLSRLALCHLREELDNLVAQHIDGTPTHNVACKARAILAETERMDDAYRNREQHYGTRRERIIYYLEKAAKRGKAQSIGAIVDATKIDRSNVIKQLIRLQQEGIVQAVVRVKDKVYTRWQLASVARKVMDGLDDEARIYSVRDVKNMKGVKVYAVCLSIPTYMNGAAVEVGGREQWRFATEAEAYQDAERRAEHDRQQGKSAVVAYSD